MKLKFLCMMIILALSQAAVIATATAAETEIEIGFSPPTTPVAPVNPDNPFLESGSPGTGQPGPLSLDWVPVLGFGTANEISAQVQEYNTTSAKPYIQVSDLRGTAEGWKVTAALEPFKQNMNETLRGAFITFLEPSTTTAATSVDSPVPAPAVMLTSDGEDVSIVTANAENREGMGTWVIRWFSGDTGHVKLTVPRSAATVGLHSSSITWTLHNAP